MKDMINKKGSNFVNELHTHKTKSFHPLKKPKYKASENQTGLFKSTCSHIRYDSSWEELANSSSLPNDEKELNTSNTYKNQRQHNSSIHQNHQYVVFAIPT